MWLRSQDQWSRFHERRYEQRAWQQDPGEPPLTWDYSKPSCGSPVRVQTLWNSIQVGSAGPNSCICCIILLFVTYYKIYYFVYFLKTAHIFWGKFYMKSFYLLSFFWHTWKYNVQNTLIACVIAQTHRANSKQEMTQKGNVHGWWTCTWPLCVNCVPKQSPPVSVRCSDIFRRPLSKRQKTNVGQG